MIKEENIIIIGGAPRSGTSLVQKILDLNSNIYGGPEFDYLLDISKLFVKMKKGIKSGRQVDYYNEEELAETFRLFIFSFLNRKPEKENVKYISEKTPNNALIFNQLVEILPKAKYVFVVRDPKAIINSMKEVYIRSKKSGGNTDVGKSLIQDLRLINEYFNHANTFIKKNSDKILIISYEKLVTHPKTEIFKLCEFINVIFEEQMLNTEIENDSSRLISKNSYLSSAFYTKEMFDKPIDKNSLENWKNGLTKSEALFINEYFLNKNYEFLRSYLILNKKKSLNFYFFTLKQLGALKSIKNLLSESNRTAN